MNRQRIVWILMIAEGICWAADSAKPVYQDVTVDFEIRASDLVERMTLEEKISQLGDAAPAIERLGIPPYNWWNECLHGVARAGTATVFPQAIGMAASFDRAMMYKTASIISDEARAKHHEFVRQQDYGRYKGLTFWSPNINIFRDPRWGRGHETYGEDPYLTGQMGIQFVRGLQGEHPRYLKVVATAKHFAVHSGPEADRHHFNAVVNTRDLWETYLPAFYDLVATAKAYSVMGAYNRVDSESASASWMLLQDILRQQWKFDGYVVSDCGAIQDIYANHKIAQNAAQAAAIGLRRGCDLECGQVYQRWLLDAVQAGMMDEGQIDRAVWRLMLARMKLGMFDPPEMVPYAQIPYSVNDCPAHSQAALEMARKSMTLLKNTGILPLDKKRIKTIAVVGPNADSTTVLRGNYYGQASHPVTVLEGLWKAAGNEVEILYWLGCPLAEGVERTAYQPVDSRYLFCRDEAGREVSGLRGDYYSGIHLEGKPVLTRIDTVINMDWGLDSPTATAVAQGILAPDKQMEADNFSVRWTGQLQPPVSGVYKLGIMSDDGCRLYIGGKKVIDGWSEPAKQPYWADVSLEKDQRCDITIEYYEASKDAGIHFVWLPPDSSAPSGRMLEDVAKADVAIFVGGLDADIEGEEMKLQADGFNRGDRTKIELPAVQLETIKAMQQTGTPVILVLMAGSAIAFDGLDQTLPAILMAWYPGQRGGDAVAEVLFGDYNPAGRLPVTFYASTQELGDFSDYAMAAGKGRTYRYYTGQPLYPFGHGLSYTEFAYSELKLSRDEAGPEETITVSAVVKNTGNRDGEEVVQLYVRDVQSRWPMPLKQLRGFERISLAKGQQKTVEFVLKPSIDMRYYDSRLSRYAVEPGEFEIQIGSSSGDIRLKKAVLVR
ncbi:MAG TPA: glycoside hydrolase family 3 C-terminal domain-containing protein [Anaerohalosphaeraceae bacterium]|nr:glycoside hydrolase family 3 C-terminal domain-containing protein [Anaerohalosphaeraceae bacterium]HOM74888.1 glycoside hydrolase family 3 C-terminal domain-containing protein [Anaerohalosphaeraceae bacterium]HPC63851.1 glycoside hydrolase family 3 C-terminal domain-containing protein [Anaerohalosphaeraceae bacterium]HPO68692.1 glycoside hydrolase family 3 C-terminal domain-containing protein [Anaerohalosphaeraceae bacterium]HRS70565.1 glycoside hydrolase family 3 C-terminal domain-containin